MKGAPVSSATINARARVAVMAEDRCLLTESGIYLAFSDQKAQKTLNKVMRTEKKMVRRMATTLKVPVASGLLKDEKFTFQRKIQKLVT